MMTIFTSLTRQQRDCVPAYRQAGVNLSVFMVEPASRTSGTGRSDYRAWGSSRLQKKERERRKRTWQLRLEINWLKASAGRSKN